MNKNWFFLFFILFGIINVHSQSIAKTWNFETTTGTESIQSDFSSTDLLILDNGRFEISSDIDSTTTSGDYLLQNNVLVFFFDVPADSIRKFRISELTDTSLSLSDNSQTYNFSEVSPPLEEVIPVGTKEIIPSQGMSIGSVWRGILGMISLLLLAYFFSSKKSAINWKTVLVGLAAQLLLALGVLKVTFIKIYLNSLVKYLCSFWTLPEQEVSSCWGE